jgi:photosystem II stability/assembly factor-like uncharacterized protein
MRRACLVFSASLLLATGSLVAQQPALVAANTFRGQLLSVAVYDPQVAIAVGTDGVILRTQDGGVNWWRIYAGSAARLEDATFTGVTVHAVGSGGTILRSSDGGVNWQLVLSDIPTRLKAVHFGDALHGVIVGDSGVALSTQDGGLTWTRSFTGVLSGLIDVRMSGPSAALAVGTGGVILRSDDGGRSWTRQSAPTSQYLTGVTMASPLSAVVVGLNATALHTADGGATWFPGSMATTSGMSDIAMVDAASYYAAGSTATIVRSTDAGRTWQTTFQSNGFAFEDIGFANAQTGWAVGNGGVIMRTADGGATWIHQMGVPGGAAVTAAPTLTPTTARPLYLSVLGLSVPGPGGRGSWSASVGSASNGNRMDELRSNGVSGETYVMTVIQVEGRTCAAVLAQLIQQGGQMRAGRPYIPSSDWFQVAVEQNARSAFTCLPLSRGVLVAGFSTSPIDITLADAEVVRPALVALGVAAQQRWGRP